MMLRKMATISAIVLAVTGFAEISYAACATMSVTGGPGTVTAWNPINGTLVDTPTFTATVTRTDTKSGSALFIFNDQDADATPRIQTSTGPRYQVLNGAVIVSYPSITTVSGATNTIQIVWGGETAANSLTISSSLKIRITENTGPTDDFIGGTTFAEGVKFSSTCYKNNNANGATNGADAGANANFSAAVTIPKVLSATLATPNPINFGSFTTTSQTAVINVKSTSTLNVSVTTTNGSQMVRSGAVAPFPANSAIPYTMTFGGSAVSPGTGGTSLTNFTRAGVSGSNYNMVLNLTGGLPTGKLTGNYSDTITLTITPGT